MIPIPAGGDGPHDPVVSRLLDMITLTERPNTPSAVLIDHTQPHLLSLVAVGTCRFHITHDLPWFVYPYPLQGNSVVQPYPLEVGVNFHFLTWSRRNGVVGTLAGAWIAGTI